MHLKVTVRLILYLLSQVISLNHLVDKKAQLYDAALQVYYTTQRQNTINILLQWAKNCGRSILKSVKSYLYNILKFVETAQGCFLNVRNLHYMNCKHISRSMGGFWFALGML